MSRRCRGEAKAKHVVTRWAVADGNAWFSSASKPTAGRVTALGPSPAHTAGRRSPGQIFGLGKADAFYMAPRATASDHKFSTG